MMKIFGRLRCFRHRDVRGCCVRKKPKGPGRVGKHGGWTSAQAAGRAGYIRRGADLGCGAAEGGAHLGMADAIMDHARILECEKKQFLFIVEHY